MYSHPSGNFPGQNRLPSSSLQLKMQEVPDPAASCTKIYTLTYFPTLALSKSGYGSEVAPPSQPVHKLPDVLFYLPLYYSPAKKDLQELFLHPAFSGQIMSSVLILLAAFLTGSLTGTVKAGIERIEILRVKLLLHTSERFAEPLEVYHFPCSQEADGIRDLRDVPDNTEDIVIGCAGFLLCCIRIETTFRNSSKFQRVLADPRGYACPHRYGRSGAPSFPWSDDPALCAAFSAVRDCRRMRF